MNGLIQIKIDRNRISEFREIRNRMIILNSIILIELLMFIDYFSDILIDGEIGYYIIRYISNID